VRIATSIRTALRFLAITVVGLSSLLPASQISHADGLSGSASDSRAAILVDDRTALKARIEMLRGAKHTINFSTYEWEPDKIGMLQLKLLAEAAQPPRNVHVQVIVDGYGGRKIPLGALRYLQESGVDVRMYHPLSIKNLKRTNQRMHDKYVSVDGVRCLKGGRNATDGFFELSHKAEKNRDDVEVVLEGPGVQGGDHVFQELFDSPDVEAVPKLKFVSSKKINAQANILKAITDERIDLLTRGAKPVQMLHVDSFEISGDPRGTLNNSEGVWKTISGVLRRTQDGVTIISPYGDFTEAQRKEIVDLRNNGKRVEIITNSMKTMGSLANQAIAVGFSKQVAWLDSIGAEVYEHEGPFMLHMKSISRDGGLETSFQSFNLGDERSEKVNSEIIVRIHAKSPQSKAWRDSVSTFISQVKSKAKLVTTPERERKSFQIKCLRGMILRHLLKSQVLRSIL
jgi:putative cardiolipin synthase